MSRDPNKHRLWAIQWREKAHAAGRCVRCNRPHKHISQVTRELAWYCFACQNELTIYQRQRLARRKAEAAVLTVPARSAGRSHG